MQPTFHSIVRESFAKLISDDEKDLLRIGKFLETLNEKLENINFFDKYSRKYETTVY